MSSSSDVPNPSSNSSSPPPAGGGTSVQVPAGNVQVYHETLGTKENEPSIRDSLIDLSDLSLFTKVADDLSAAVAEQVASEYFLDEIVIEVNNETLSGLGNLTENNQVKKLRRVTLVANDRSFPTIPDNDLHIRLHNILKNAPSVEIFTIQITAKVPNWQGRGFFIRAFAAVLNNIAFTNLREIRVFTDDPLDIRHMEAYYTAPVPARQPTPQRLSNWTIGWNSFRALHLFVPRLSIGVDANARSFPHYAMTTLLPSESLSSLLLARPNVATLTVSGTAEAIAKTGHTPYVTHVSGSIEETRALLGQVRGVVGLVLCWKDADAQTIIEFVMSNKDTLKNIKFEVILQSGTWDTIFAALRYCSLLDIRPLSPGMMYAGIDGPFLTEYLCLEVDLRQVPVLRYTDRHELTRLLTSIQTNRRACGQSIDTSMAWISAITGYRNPDARRIAAEQQSSWRMDTTFATPVTWHGYLLKTKRGKSAAEKSAAQEAAASANA